MVNYFLSLDKHSVDLILVQSLLISLQLCCFSMELLFQLFYHCSYIFFLYFILRFRFPIFFFPPYLSSLVMFQDVYVYIYCSEIFILVSVICSVLICFNMQFIFLDHSVSTHLVTLLNPLSSIPLLSFTKSDIS